MKILPPGIDDAVGASDDKLGRDGFGRGLLSLFERSADPLVVALDEPWGMGKTVFVRRTLQAADKMGFTTVYFDAFQRDHDPDVFIALAAEILALLPAQEKEAKGLRERTKKVARIIGRLALKSAVRVATAGAISASDLGDDDVADEIGDEIEKEVDQIIEARIRDATKEAQTFELFRKQLAEAAAARGSGKPLLFAIDELDRCRPDYALSVLETIKHLFSVPNVHFLLSCDLQSLGEAVSHVYGLKRSSSRYLEKFVHIRVNFPQIRDRDAERIIKDFTLDILRLMPEDSEKGQEKDSFASFVAKQWRSGKYSLRTIERVCTLFGMCLAFTGKDTLRLQAIIHVLCDLKINHPEIYEKAKRNSLTYGEIKSLFGFSDDPRKRENDLDWYAINWRYFLLPDEELNEKDHQGFSSLMFRYNIERLNVVSFTAQSVVDRFAFPV